MYFVQYNPLKQKLRSRTLTDDEALPYLVLDAIVATLLCLDISSDPLNPFDWVSLFLSVVITIGGISHVYNQNGGKDGVDLVQKFLVLGWVVGVRLFLTFIPVMIAIVLFALLSNLEDAGIELLSLLFATAYVFIFYQRLGVHIQDTTDIEPQI